ncbi:hypothetical protein Bbelb_010370 [Branchiostoma belcheri]|nr:hypothetical protein Bbelb_010370 [Branchiostoma belcheri]
MDTVRLSGSQALSPAHPTGQTDCGGATPYWLGAAQLKAGGSCPMRCDDLSHRRKQPLAPYSTPIELFPTQQAPPLHPTGVAQRKGKADTAGTSGVAGLVEGEVVLTSYSARLSTAHAHTHDDAALAAHTENKLQILLDKLSCACQDFSLTISLKKTKVMCQGVDHPPSITINNYELEVVPKFTYLGSTVTNNLSLEAELNGRIGRAATTFARLQKRVWDVLTRASIPSMYTLLKQRRLRWLGHVCRMPDGRIPKDLLYSELASGTRARGRPHLRFKDVVKRDMKDMDIDINTWETLTTSRTLWRQTVKKGLQRGEEKQRLKSEHRRLKRKAKTNKYMM